MKSVFATNTRNLISALSLLSATLISPQALSYKVPLGDYEWLPTWCRYMQSSIYKPQLPHEAAKWRAYLGHNWIHDHHYCWALSLRMKAFKERDKMHRDNLFKDVIQNLEYVITRSDGPRIIDPEIYYYMAESHELRGELHLAERYYLVALEKKPSFLRGILKLIDFYIERKKYSQASLHLNKGLQNHPESKALARRKARLEKLQ